MKASQIHFDLKRPCKDCPFKISTPMHGGVMKSLTEYSASIDLGEFAHTCHKTDFRADSVEGKKYQGTVQHCAGALALMKNDCTAKSIWVCEKEIKGEIDFDKIDSSGVFKNFMQMVLAYCDWAKGGYKNNLATKTKKELKSAGYKA